MAAAIKLWIDAHAKYYWVSRQVDVATPQPVQRMTYDELLLFVVIQQKFTNKVVKCFEAGALPVDKAIPPASPTTEWMTQTSSNRQANAT